MLAAALWLLLNGRGHRGHAPRCCRGEQVLPGAIRYYFRTREDLLAACLEEIELFRSNEAERGVDLAGHGGPIEVGQLA